MADEIILRRWLRSDIAALVRYVNNRNVWITLRDRMPQPYTRSDAEDWVALNESQGEPTYNFAIDLNDEAIGGIGFEPMTDVHRLTAEIGYWIGEPFWGRGFATIALERATTYSFTTLGLERIQASVLAAIWHPRAYSKRLAIPLTDAYAAASSRTGSCSIHIFTRASAEINA